MTTEHRLDADHPMSVIDLSTPQAAIATLEAAYVSRDLEAAVAAKDFTEEARRMLLNRRREWGEDAKLIAKTAQVLELAYRKEMSESGFPDMSGVQCTLTTPEFILENLVGMIENCTYPDGGISRQTVHVFRSSKGWRYVILPDDQ